MMSCHHVLHFVIVVSVCSMIQLEKQEQLAHPDSTDGERPMLSGELARLSLLSFSLSLSAYGDLSHIHTHTHTNTLLTLSAEGDDAFTKAMKEHGLRHVSANQSVRALTFRDLPPPLDLDALPDLPEEILSAEPSPPRPLAPGGSTVQSARASPGPNGSGTVLIKVEDIASAPHVLPHCPEEASAVDANAIAAAGQGQQEEEEGQDVTVVDVTEALPGHDEEKSTLEERETAHDEEKENVTDAAHMVHPPPALPGDGVPLLACHAAHAMLSGGMDQSESALSDSRKVDEMSVIANADVDVGVGGGTSDIVINAVVINS